MLPILKIDVAQDVDEPADTSPCTIGVYLRLLNIPIPGSYGPSADETQFLMINNKIVWKLMIDS
jgi:hypothetical protein